MVYETLSIPLFRRPFLKSCFLGPADSRFLLDVAEHRGGPREASGDLEEANFSVPLHKGGNHLLNSPHKWNRLLWISLLIHLDTLSRHFRAVDTSSHFQPFQQLRD